MIPWTERIEEALRQPAPLKGVRALAIECRDGGMPQRELVALFEQIRERHAVEPEGVAYNAVLEVMDFISGWCAPHNRLFPD
jgi:hypothetical protein